MKPGFLSSEFWLTLVSMALPVLAVLDVLSPDEVATLEQAIVDAVKVIGSLVFALVPLWRYIDGRAKVKALTGVATRTYVTNSTFGKDTTE